MKKLTKRRIPYQLVTYFVRLIAFMFYHPKIKGLDNIKNIQSTIFAPNHIAFSDPPIIGSFLNKEITAIAKRELFHNKLIGNVLRYLNAIPIRRAIFDKNALGVAEDRLRNGYNILIFPEGTRKASKPKAGIGVMAYNTQAKVVPVFIKNSNNFWSCFFFIKRLEIIYGEPLNLTEFYRKDESKQNYRDIANHIYKEILNLEESC